MVVINLSAACVIVPVFELELWLLIHNALSSTFTKTYATFLRINRSDSYLFRKSRFVFIRKSKNNGIELEIRLPLADKSGSFCVCFACILKKFLSIGYFVNTTFSLVDEIAKCGILIIMDANSTYFHIFV